jgi:hypothetical protein
MQNEYNAATKRDNTNKLKHTQQGIWHVLTAPAVRLVSTRSPRVHPMGPRYYRRINSSQRNAEGDFGNWWHYLLSFHEDVVFRVAPTDREPAGGWIFSHKVVAPTITKLYYPKLLAVVRIYRTYIRFRKYGDLLSD